MAGRSVLTRLMPTASLALALAPIAPIAFGAEGSTIDTRRFPKLAHLLLLPEEQSLLKELKDDKDGRAFQAIFWARRDPSPGTPANEFEDNVRAAWKHADELFSYPNEKGSETGCGQVIVLLGPPEEIVGPPGAPRTLDNMAYVRDGAARSPETWVYRDRPRLPYHFTGAELRVAFDAECRFAEAGPVAEDLRRAAAALVTRPTLSYVVGGDGQLVPLSPAVSTATAMGGARALLAHPRSDFPLAAEPKLVMRTARGETYVAGLVAATTDTGAAPVGFSVAAEAKDASGSTAATSSLDVAASTPVAGRHLASWGLSLKPGHYELKVAGQIAEQGAVVGLPLDVPDFGSQKLAASPLVAYPDEPQAPAAATSGDPYAALKLGALRLRPRVGNVFARSDALMVVATLYGAKLDPATGKAALRARFSVLKGGRPVARGAEDVFATADAVASVGPIPLGGYAVGAYLLRLDVTDGVTGETLRQEAAFEVHE
jgi:GWxTD domain-containing protein